MDPKSVIPGTDKGSDTFARYIYQAEVTFPYCLHCALGDEIISVIPEHLEDMALEYEDRWRFLQIKSRNPERGTWRLSHLLVPGAALRTLFATYKQLPEAHISLELVLEGAVKSGDPLENLRKGEDHAQADLLAAVSEKLEIGIGQARRFLEKVFLVTPPPPREYIRAENLNLLHEQNPKLDRATVEAVYSRFLEEIEKAMRAARLGSEWPSYVVHPEILPSEAEQKMQRKRLTKAYLEECAGPIKSKAKYLLRRLTGQEFDPVSILERKLLRGGATQEVITDARSLRANAQRRRFELQAQRMSIDNSRIEDLRHRLQTHFNAKKAVHAGSERPAILIWHDLLEQLAAGASNIDYHGLYSGDPMLLLGEICELADECVLDWGLASAN